MSLRSNLGRLVRRFEKDFETHNRIEISRSALLHNLALFERLSDQDVIPVLKGNAYGHGIKLVAEVLKTGKKIPYIAVDGYFEALRVRAVSSQPVLIMGAILPVNFGRITYDNFSFVVHDEVTVHALGQTGRKIKVHLECNSGMNRYGVQPAEVARFTNLILRYKNLELEGVMSHLADSDGDSQLSVDQAVKTFDACVKAVKAAGARPTIIHVAQSAGSLKAKSRYANTMRLGIGLYGINPFPPQHRLYRKLQTELRPALTLTSTIVKTIELKKGEKISYNYTFTAPRDMKIGVLPLGYYEGVSRSLSNKGIVKIGDHFAPIVGRVCMNHTMISLEGSNARPGDSVVVYSDNPVDKNAIDAIASSHDLFSYNLLTALNSTVRRILVG